MESRTHRTPRSLLRGATLFAAAAAAPLLALSVVLGACTLVTDLDGFASSSEAGPPGIGGDGDSGVRPETSPDGTTSDASADAEVADAPPVEPCTEGGTRAPVAVSLYPGSVSSTSGCRMEQMLAVDGLFGGLDRAAGSSDTTLAGENITSCALFDFGTVHAVARVAVTLRAAASACNLSPCTTGTDSGCDTGQFTHIFVSTDAVEFEHAAYATFTRHAEVEEVAVKDATLRYVLVCRGATGPARDDIEIDGVRAICL